MGLESRKADGTVKLHLTLLAVNSTNRQVVKMTASYATVNLTPANFTAIVVNFTYRILPTALVGAVAARRVAAAEPSERLALGDTEV